MACQRVTNAIAYIMATKGFVTKNYLDDFGMAEKADRCNEGFQTLGNVLQELGFEESLEKAVAPITRMSFLGILIDTVSLTLEIPEEKLKEISLLVKIWLEKKSATRRQMESFIGKLKFVAQCVRPGRVFIWRMLERIRQLEDRDKQGPIGSEFKRDLDWWDRFLVRYNGVSIISEELWCELDQSLATDACLVGAGGISFDLGEYFHVHFPEPIRKEARHINGLEMLAIMIAVKLWGTHWSGKKIKLYCDNLTTVQALNVGKIKDCFMLDCLREILFQAAVFGFEFRACHIKGKENRLPDHLSRWNVSANSRRAFKRETCRMKLARRSISNSLFQFTNNW